MTAALQRRLAERRLAVLEKKQADPLRQRIVWWDEWLRWRYAQCASSI
jgi:hypothetical protein